MSDLKKIQSLLWSKGCTLRWKFKKESGMFVSSSEGSSWYAELKLSKDRSTPGYQVRLWNGSDEIFEKVFPPSHYLDEVAQQMAEAINAALKE